MLQPALQLFVLVEDAHKFLRVNYAGCAREKVHHGNMPLLAVSISWHSLFVVLA